MSETLTGVESANDKDGSICPKCGTKNPVSRPIDRCPVCQLRAALESDLPDTADLSDVVNLGGEATLAEAAAVTKPALQTAPGLASSDLSGVASLGDGAKSDLSDIAKGGDGAKSDQFEHYELLKHPDGRPIELGRGAMGVTYRAFDRNLRCPVALKVINARYLNDESARVRFVREARAAARLRHPNVASVFHLGTRNGEYFYAMEFVEGETVDQLIRRKGSLPVPVAIDIVDQVAAALEAAFKEQIVHRDIKPGNMLVRFSDDGAPNVKVIDFGLVKATASVQSEADLSLPGGFTGTALFASPEQCAGGEVDTRSDIYSLGVTFWEILTAKLPFTGSTGQVIGQHLHAPLPLKQLKGLPPAVVALLKKMLAKNPDQRPQTPSELRSQLRALKLTGRDELVGLASKATLHRAIAWKRVWLGAGILILAIGIAAGLFLWHANAQIGVKSIAVLPFDNVGGNQSNDYFGDGLTSEVIYQLSKLSDLRVTARGSIVRYRAVAGTERKPLKEIGAELDVGVILESSIQRADNRVRIVTILYNARTGERVWGSTYDRELKDVLTIQTDLAEQIATALHARLSENERAGLQNAPTTNATAYNLYLQGRAQWELHQQDANEKAVDFFKQALEQDPKFVLAYIGLADCYIDRVKRFHLEQAWLDSAINLCQQAITLDPGQLRAYTELANAYNLKGWIDKMEEPVRKALELAPNDWDANRMAAAESTELRRPKEMYSSIRKCFVTNPFDSWAPYELALICWSNGAKDLAEKWMQRAIDLETNPPRRQLMEEERFVYRGDYAAALPGLRQLPPDLKTHYTVAGDLVLFCCMQVGNWPTVTNLIQSKSDKDSPTNQMRLALAARGVNEFEEANQIAARMLVSAQAKLPTAKSPRWMRFDLAIGNRLLERKAPAYQYLRELIDSGGFPDPVLGRVDPALDVFKSDSEFETLQSEITKKDAEIRTQIQEIEKEF
ncbi:MAG: protein kinase [Verrucomicrobia bacterium]|nr:protein kinase [Verrucomicrobiota bacterium]